MKNKFSDIFTDADLVEVKDPEPIFDGIDVNNGPLIEIHEYYENGTWHRYKYFEAKH